MRTIRSIPLRTFNNHTRFAIDPSRNSTTDSGCIEVQLVNHNNGRTPAGGNGLTIAGTFQELPAGSTLTGRFALLVGFNEVFELVSEDNGCVVLKPLGIGLGVRWELFRQFSKKTSRKRRLREKYSARARKYFTDSRIRMAQLTGTVGGMALSPDGPFFVQEQTVTGAQDAKRFDKDTQVPAITFADARKIASARVAMLQAQGWKVRNETGKSQSVAGNRQWPKGTKRVSVEVGVARPLDPEDLRYIERGGGSMTADEIVEARTSWANYPGFTADSCGKCLTLVNVLAGGGSWFCANCGHLNLMCWAGHQIPHEHPDFGPTLTVIREGHERTTEIDYVITESTYGRGVEDGNQSRPAAQ